MNDKRRKLNYLKLRHGRKGVRIYRANKSTRKGIFQKLMKAHKMGWILHKVNRFKAQKMANDIGGFDSVCRHCEALEKFYNYLPR